MVESIAHRKEHITRNGKTDRRTMMNNPIQNVLRFFSVMGNGQSYLNMIYLLASFPLGVFYFVFLVSGLSLGISLVIIWVGIPILLIVGIGIWGFANFERSITIHLLKEDLPSLSIPTSVGTDIWARIKNHLLKPVTWKSILYLSLKFPLGIFTFVVLATLISLTLAFLTMPINFNFMHSSQAGIFLNSSNPIWTIDSLGDALLLAIIGLMMWPITMHVSNRLAWVHAKFARIMLNNDSIGRLNLTQQAG
jgi:hypothetical protein